MLSLRGFKKSVSSGAVSRKSRSSRIVPAFEMLENRQMMTAIPLPTIPTTIFNVTSYGAKNDGKTNDTASIQAAINAAIAAGGGIVEIPSGTFLSNALTLGNKVNLQVESGGTLRMEPYGTYANGTTELITASSASNVEISGSGTIDGQGAGWYSLASGSRADLIRFTNCNIVEVTGVKIENSPKEHLVFSSTNNVTVNGITISASSTSPNTDGIDPAGSNYLIENCTIADGDDDVAIKALSVACTNITIQGCKIGSGHGISVGGQTNLGANGLTVTNCTFNGTTNGLRLKAGEGNGGLVQNVSYSNITMTNVANPIYITSWYINGGDTSPSDPSTATKGAVDSVTPIWKNITFTNVSDTGASNAGIIYGLPQEYIQTVTFNDVVISAKKGMELYYVSGVQFTGGSKFTITSGAKLLEYDATVTGTP
jgi:polygalacturonase